MSFRRIEDLLAERGIEVTYGLVYKWAGAIGPKFTRESKRQGSRGTGWFSDEITVSILGRCRDLWRTVDLDGDVLDMLLQKRMNPDAAMKKCFARDDIR